MKKGIIVLLVMALVASFAFAAEPTFSGSATTTFSFDLDGNHDYGFNAEAARPSVTTKFVFSFDKITLKGGSTGETKPYAVIEGVAEVKATDITLQMGVPGKADITTASDAFTLKLSAKITKAAIVGETWELNLLGATFGSDYAISAIDARKAADKKYYALDFAYDYDAVAGVTLTLNQYGTVGFGLVGDKNAANVAVFAETAEDLLKFGDVSLMAAGTFSSVAGDKKAGASVSADYAAEKLTAGVAADFGYDASQFNTDVALNAAYTEADQYSVTADVYYATYAVAVNAVPAVFDQEVNYLGAKVVADITTIKTDVTVEAYDLLDDPSTIAGAKAGRKELNVTAHTTIVENLDLTVLATDLINATREVGVKVSYTGIENLTLSAAALELINKQALSVDAVYTGIENITVAAGAGYTIASKALYAYGRVDYAHDMFDAYAQAEFGTVVGAKGATLGLSAGVTSTKLVDNATLSLIWADLDADGYTTNDVLNDSFGKITAAVKVAF